MADDFKILKTGAELSGNRGESNEGNNGFNWWFAVCTVFIALGTAVWAYKLGENSVAPKLKAANDEKTELNNAMGNCPVYKKALSKSDSQTSEVAKESKNAKLDS